MTHTKYLITEFYSRIKIQLVFKKWDEKRAEETGFLQSDVPQKFL